VALPTWTDSTLTAGRAGVMIYAWAATTDYYVDDWTGGDLSGSSIIPVLVAYYNSMRN
jgi:hypothetical protein